MRLWNSDRYFEIIRRKKLTQSNYPLQALDIGDIISCQFPEPEYKPGQTLFFKVGSYIKTPNYIHVPLTLEFPIQLGCGVIGTLGIVAFNYSLNGAILTTKYYADWAGREDKTLDFGIIVHADIVDRPF